MKTKCNLSRRGRVFYYQDRDTGQPRSLKTADRKKAEHLLLAMNEAQEHSTINLELARAYLAAHDWLASSFWSSCQTSRAVGHPRKVSQPPPP